MDIILGSIGLAIFIGYVVWSEWRVAWRDRLLRESFTELAKMSKSIKEIIRRPE